MVVEASEEVDYGARALVAALMGFETFAFTKAPQLVRLCELSSCFIHVAHTLSFLPCSPT